MKKLLAVSSAGGHWTQLMIISEAFIDFDVTYMTTSMNSALARRPHNTKAVTVRQANISQKLGMLFLAFQVLVKVAKLRPDLIVSTGAAPGFFAVFFGRFIGAKTIWVDSVANYEKLSLSGEKIKPFCHRFVTQWEHLSEPGEYIGKVL